MRPDPLTSDSDRKPACPSCEAFRVVRRTRRTKTRDASAWRCDECGATFDVPAYDVPDHLSTVRPHLSAAGRAALEWEEAD